MRTSLFVATLLLHASIFFAQQTQGHPLRAELVNRLGADYREEAARALKATDQQQAHAALMKDQELTSLPLSEQMERSFTSRLFLQANKLGPKRTGFDVYRHYLMVLLTAYISCLCGTVWTTEDRDVVMSGVVWFKKVGR
jgi:hypothetical protein